MQRAHRTAAVVFASISVFAGSPASQQDSPRQEPEKYRFETEVQVIPVPVFVTDKEGQPVEGLTVGDFEVKEEGESRPIVVFDHMTFARLSTWRDRDELHPALRRNFLLFFDLTFSSPRGILRARDAALDFVRNQLQPSDLVCVATYSHRTGMKTLSSFTDDHHQAARVIETLGLIRTTDVTQDRLGFVFDTLLETPEALGAYPPSTEDLKGQAGALLDNLRAISARMERSQQDEYRSQASQYLEQLSALNFALGRMSGRKFILFLSEGVESSYILGTGVAKVEEDFAKFAAGDLASINTDQRFGRIELRGLLMEALQRAAGSDVVIHTFDVSGLAGEAGEPGRSEGRGQDTLYLMATQTGGEHYKNLNDLRQPLQRILQETSAFYLLGFQPKDLQRKGRFRRIEVQVGRLDVRVSARRGYFEPNPTDKMTPPERAMQLVDYISKDVLSDDVFFDTLVSVYPGEGHLARVPVYLKFPGKQFLEGQHETDVMQLEVYGYVVDAEGRFVDFFNRTLSFDLAKEQDRLRRAGIKYYDLLLARPGPIRLKLIARDVQSGKIGSFIEDIEIPDFLEGRLTLTPPIFVVAEPEWIVARGIDPAHLEERRLGMPVAYPFKVGENEFIPAVRPSLRKDTPTNLVVRAYNLKVHPETAQPQTAIKFHWMDAEGRVETIHQVALYQKPVEVETGCYELVFQVRWDDVPQGPALLQMSLTDLIANQTVQVATPYVLVP